MFNCYFCGGTAPAQTPAVKVVIQRRGKKYPYRRDANMFFLIDRSGKKKKILTDDPGGTGWEIEREVLSCSSCAQNSSVEKQPY